MIMQAGRSPAALIQLLARAQRAAGHRTYGDPLEAYRRYAEAFGIDTRQTSRGDAPVEDALLDDEQAGKQPPSEEAPRGPHLIDD